MQRPSGNCRVCSLDDYIVTDVQGLEHTFQRDGTGDLGTQDGCGVYYNAHILYF